MEVQIRIAGAAGQGMATAGDPLGRAATRAGWYVYAYNDVESRIRGGVNFMHLRIARRPVHAPSAATDLLVALTTANVDAWEQERKERGW